MKKHYPKKVNLSRFKKAVRSILSLAPMLSWLNSAEGSLLKKIERNRLIPVNAPTNPSQQVNYEIHKENNPINIGSFYHGPIVIEPRESLAARALNIDSRSF